LQKSCLKYHTRPDAIRTRKLLLHSKEIAKLKGWGAKNVVFYNQIAEKLEGISKLLQCNEINRGFVPQFHPADMGAIWGGQAKKKC
jgi:hypothetical protein